jgi:glycerol-3-phosphate dehydrogenase
MLKRKMANRSEPSQLRADLCDWIGTGGPCELLVVGGGATGLGVALQAALEGRDVALVEARDFASGTSSRSTKLLHGGVRYLAQGRLGLVREALRERTTVMRLAPHLAQPLSFVVRTTGFVNRAWMSMGLHAYDWLSGSHGIGMTESTHTGLRYWDAQFEDARFALALARTARRAGARLRNHTRVKDLRQVDGVWEALLVDELVGTQGHLRAKTVVNATGVWVDALRQAALASTGHAVSPIVRASQGIHLVVPRSRLPIDEAILVPRTADGRVLFAIPWLGSTVVGTTDTPREDAPTEPRPFKEEVRFLLAHTQRWLGVTLCADDVRSVWAGLRPLVSPRSKINSATRSISREHVVLRDAPGLFTVTGGKWTTYRSMAEDVLKRMQHSRDISPPSVGTFDTREHRLVGAPAAGPRPFSLSDAPGPHLWGTEAALLQTLPGASRDLGGGLTEAMVRFSAREEWALTVEDILARRWRLLFLDAREAARLAPRVAPLLREETGIEPRLDEFLALCEQYLLPREWVFKALLEEVAS